MSIRIIQQGRDGFGHQLEGFFTCLILHNVNRLSFDAFCFLEKDFQFEHVNQAQTEDLKKYLQEVVTVFYTDYSLTKQPYEAIVHTHEVYNIPQPPKESIVYSLDNVFFYKKIFVQPHDQAQIYHNICRMKGYFINRMLPECKLVENNIVIHVRLGDALTNGREHNIRNYTNKILTLIDLFRIQYPNHTYYIHSDGEPTDLLQKIGSNYIFYNKDTPVLDALSDFIHAKILVCGWSSLSTVCSEFGNKELIIMYDAIEHSMSENPKLYTITNYLSKGMGLER